MMHPSPSLVWFRQDLRTADNPALTSAAARGHPIIALYILDEGDAWRIGGAARWWLHHALVALKADLAARNIPLVLRRGSAGEILPHFIAENRCAAVFWNRCYEPFAIRRDTAIKAALTEAGIAVESFNGTLLLEPWVPKTQAGQPFRVFTPFWKVLRGAVSVTPLPDIEPLAPSTYAPESDDIADWSLLPTAPDWAGGLKSNWRPGQAGAQDRLQSFLVSALTDYKANRDRPGVDGVSRLSPHLHWGEISLRQVWSAAETVGGPAAEPFLRELAWREFSYHLLWQFPDLPEKPLTGRFETFPWRDDPGDLKRWQRGLTGYPLVDAGMRELWTTGWMHNRVRMVTASFLVKHLLLHWRHGEDWFWDTLVDADLANNAASWQWVAGCGADAAPYFRIFNPVLQGEKFDSDGRYVRHYVPELARLPECWLHKPWQAPPDILASAGVILGKTYPHPIVEHSMARDRALAALTTVTTP